MIYIPSMKTETRAMPIQPLADASFLYLPLQKYGGSVPVPVIKVGDAIKKYQLIAKSPENSFSSNIHSPVSGVIHQIKELPQADGSSALTIIVENDFENKELVFDETDWKTYSPPQIVEVIERAGVVGEGGAQFPTAIKYRIDGAQIDTFIINGVECEPYLTADYALMSERASELFEGIVILNKVLQATDIVIAIEKQSRQLLKVFQPLLERLEYNNVRVVVLEDKYPQGGELQLIKLVTGIELPRYQRSKDVGVMVSNVGTVCAVYNAVAKNRPVISRILTVSGEGSENIGNFDVKVGTSIGHILNELNLTANNRAVVLGGPMMGKPINDWSVSIAKGSGGLLLLKKEEVERHNCISCGYCVEVCPMHLMPMKFDEYYQRGKYFNMEKYDLSSCIECAACEYVCPSNVPLIESIKEGKLKLKELANAIQ